jgi:hypothetical protein
MKKLINLSLFILTSTLIIAQTPEIITIEFLDITARKIKSINTTSQQTFTIDVSDLSAGVYMVNV